MTSQVALEAAASLPLAVVTRGPVQSASVFDKW